MWPAGATGRLTKWRKPLVGTEPCSPSGRAHGQRLAKRFTAAAAPRGAGRADRGGRARARSASDAPSSGNGWGRYCLLMAGIGIDATIVRSVDLELKRPLGFGAYWAAGLNSSPGCRSPRSRWRPQRRPARRDLRLDRQLRRGTAGGSGSRRRRGSTTTTSKSASSIRAAGSSIYVTRCSASSAATRAAPTSSTGRQRRRGRIPTTRRSCSSTANSSATCRCASSASRAPCAWSRPPPLEGERGKDSYETTDRHTRRALMALYLGLTHLTPATVRGLILTARCGAGSGGDRRGRPRLRSATLLALAPAAPWARPPGPPSRAGAALPPEVIAVRDEGAWPSTTWTTRRRAPNSKRCAGGAAPTEGDMLLCDHDLARAPQPAPAALQTSLYRDESRFYAGDEKAKEETGGDAVDPASTAPSADRMAQAKVKALSLATRDKEDPDALYFLGAVYGVLAVRGLDGAQNSWPPLRHGRARSHLHEKVVKLRPDYYDAYSRWLYHYIVGNLPFPVRTLAAVGGFRGDERRGIKEIQQVVEKGRQAAGRARVLPSPSTKNREPPRRRSRCSAAQREVLAQLPPQARTASTLVGLEACARGLRDLRRAAQGLRLLQSADLVHYQYAEALAAGHEYAPAAEKFLAAARCRTPSEPGDVLGPPRRAGLRPRRPAPRRPSPSTGPSRAPERLRHARAPSAGSRSRSGRRGRAIKSAALRICEGSATENRLSLEHA